MSENHAGRTPPGRPGRRPGLGELMVETQALQGQARVFAILYVLRAISRGIARLTARLKARPSRGARMQPNRREAAACTDCGR